MRLVIFSFLFDTDHTAVQQKQAMIFPPLKWLQKTILNPRTQSYWIQLSLSQSYTILNWCRLYSRHVLGAKGKCVWLLRYSKVRTASLWRDPKGWLVLRAHAVSSSILPVALTSTDDNGRPREAMGKCCTCQFSAGERTEDWLHTCPEISLFFMSVRVKMKLFCLFFNLWKECLFTWLV